MSINMFITCCSEFISFFPLLADSTDLFSCLNIVKKLKLQVSELPVPILKHRKSPQWPQRKNDFPVFP